MNKWLELKKTTKISSTCLLIKLSILSTNLNVVRNFEDKNNINCKYFVIFFLLTFKKILSRENLRKILINYKKPHNLKIKNCYLKFFLAFLISFASDNF